MANIVRHYCPDGTHEDIHELLTLEYAQHLLGGWVESHTYGALTVWCDEEGRMKQLRHTANIRANVYVGDLFIGRLTDDGLAPVPEEEIAEFELVSMVLN